MPANRVNYLVLYVGDSQLYGTATEKIALETPPPDDIPLEDKRVLFISFEPDNEVLTVHPVPQEKVLNAEIKYKVKKTETEEDF